MVNLKTVESLHSAEPVGKMVWIIERDGRHVLKFGGPHLQKVAESVDQQTEMPDFFRQDYAPFLLETRRIESVCPQPPAPGTILRL